MIQRRDGWMFLSHSSEDFELVRQIRNTLEDHGFRPITFFLKCITDSTELDGLIKREIEARRWFVFVDSENSRSSKWAQEELAYAKELKKVVYSIDTTKDYLPQLHNLLRRTTVFLSYCHVDKLIADQIRQSLIDNDFQTLWSDDIDDLANNWNESTSQKIRDAGCCLLLLSEASMHSISHREEIFFILLQHCPIVCVYLGDVRLTPGMEMRLSVKQGVFLSNKPTDLELDNLIRAISRFG